jgi:hypothetical protein
MNERGHFRTSRNTNKKIVQTFLPPPPLPIFGP